MMNAPVQDQLEAKFRTLVAQWKEGRGPESLTFRMAMHPAYQQIIGMGPSAVPLILDELRKEPDHWFWALRAITGASPVKKEHRGKIEHMAADWIEWGRQNGYL